MAISAIFLALFPLLLLASIFPSSNGHDITHILSRHPEFSSFNQHLTTTGLAEQINRQMTITVCAVDNPTMRRFLAKWGPSPTALRHIMSLHVLMDYYTPKKLRHLIGSTTEMETLFGPTNHLAFGYPMRVNITDFLHGRVVRFSTNPRGPVAYFVRSIKEIPYNISVIQITEILSRPRPTPNHRTVLTKVMSSFGCELFAKVLSGTQAEKIYANNVDTGLTIFCPWDGAFKTFLPRFNKLSENDKNALLLAHAVPVYQSFFMLKENYGWFDTLATDSLNRFRLKVGNGEREEVTLKTGVVSTRIVGHLIDDIPLAIYVAEEVLLPKALFSTRILIQ